MWKYSVGLTRFNLNDETNCLKVENEPWWRGTKMIWWRARNAPGRQEKRTLYYFIRFLSSKHSMSVPSSQIQSPERATFLTMNSVTWSHLVRMQCSSGGTRSVSLYSGHSFVVSLSRERWNYLKATSTRIRIFLKPIFSSVLSLLPSTIKRRFQAPKTYVL